MHVVAQVRRDEVVLRDGAAVEILRQLRRGVRAVVRRAHRAVGVGHGSTLEAISLGE